MSKRPCRNHSPAFKVKVALALQGGEDAGRVGPTFTPTRSRNGGPSCCRAHVATLMEKMVCSAICRRRNTSKPAPGHRSTPTCCASWR